MTAIPQRRCKSCLTEYPATAEHFPVRKGKLEPWRCRPCERQRVRDWFAQNTDRKRAANAAYHARMQQARTVPVAQQTATPLVSVEAIERWVDRQHRASWSYGHRQRAQRYGVSYESVDRREVWQRSGGCCHICGVAVDGGERWTVDHLIPLVLGGPHSLDNLAVAHLSCNSRKRAKLLLTHQLIVRYSDIVVRHERSRPGEAEASAFPA